VVLVLVAVFLFVVSGFIALLATRSDGKANFLGGAGAIAGSAVGVVSVLDIIVKRTAPSIRLQSLLPFDSFFVGVDLLSAFFLFIIFGFSLVAAIYGSEYLNAYRGEKKIGIAWFSYNLLTASMALVVISKNAFLFLISWEIMTIASFFLVILENEKPDNRNAGLIYLIASHLGTAFLFAFFLLLAKQNRSLDFDKFTVIKDASLLFIFSLIGFGTKAGLMPFHVWLPQAHPAAPSFVSAVMSGVMIKTGIYGILRTILFLGPPETWWGVLLIVLGVISGVGGVLFALAQHDIKRLLAYHSVENIGIIVMGIGLGLLGLKLGSSSLMILGFSGAVLHTLNHAIFKGLLFLCAGVVVSRAGTRDIDKLGGLIKTMPSVALCFLIGAIAISGLPPLNGFVSEFLIYLGMFKGGVFSPTPITIVPCVLAFASLALIGGLAAACFTKVFGIVFLGEPRTRTLVDANVPLSIKIPLFVLALLCLFVGLLSPIVLKWIAPLIDSLSGLTVSLTVLSATNVALTKISIAGIIFIGLVAFLAYLRFQLVRRRQVTKATTWDCGYHSPSPKMQYTASSFAWPLISMFGKILRGQSDVSGLSSYFPGASAYHSKTPDVFDRYFYHPLFSWTDKQMHHFRRFQHGRVQLYILYIVITLVVLLIWQTGLPL